LENHGNQRYDDGGDKSAIDETAIGTEPRDAVEGDPSNGEENIFEAVYVNEQLTTPPQGKIDIEMGNPRFSPPCTQRAVDLTRMHINPSQGQTPQILPLSPPNALLLTFSLNLTDVAHHLENLGMYLCI